MKRFVVLLPLILFLLHVSLASEELNQKITAARAQILENQKKINPQDPKVLKLDKEVIAKLNEPKQWITAPEMVNNLLFVSIGQTSPQATSEVAMAVSAKHNVVVVVLTGCHGSKDGKIVFSNTDFSVNSIEDVLKFTMVKVFLETTITPEIQRSLDDYQANDLAADLRTYPGYAKYEELVDTNKVVEAEKLMTSMTRNLVFNHHRSFFTERQQAVFSAMFRIESIADLGTHDDVRLRINELLAERPRVAVVLGWCHSEAWYSEHSDPKSSCFCSGDKTPIIKHLEEDLMALATN
jgi:hypothetical protein